MSEPQVATEVKKPVPGERPLREQLTAVRDKIADDQNLADPIAKLRKLVADNYNESRDVSKMPMLTPQLIDILWFTGTKANWRAIAESPIVYGIRYEVTYNAQRGEAFIYVYRKINNTKVEGC
jgi:hypothetical protein